CVVDLPDWAHDRKTDALARELGSFFEIVKRFRHNITERDIETAHCVFLSYWLQVEQLSHLRDVLRSRRDRLLIGICSRYELTGDWREPGLATLGELASAVFVNNRLLLDEFSPHLQAPIYYTPNG